MCASRRCCSVCDACSGICEGGVFCKTARGNSSRSRHRARSGSMGGRSISSWAVASGNSSIKTRDSNKSNYGSWSGEFSARVR